MALKSFFIPITFAAALAVSAAPASAQHGGGGHMGGGHSSGGHSAVGQHGGGGSFHGENHAPGDVGQSRGQDRSGRFDGHDGFGSRGGRGFDGPFAHVRVIRPFFGPFFAFRPRFDLGFGFFVGYPVPYPWDYVTPYPYDDPYDADPYGSTYSDPEDWPSAPSADQRNYGGVSLDITPGDAIVTVDGANAGTAQTYSPSSAPLTLVPGRHRIVIEKPGYRVMTFDADVTQGQVVPYQGTLQPE
jgi:PEGA domain